MTPSFRLAVEQLSARVAHLLQHHPRHVTAALAALLLGGGGGAYAVASIAPDPALWPVRQVIEAVESLPLQAQSDALQVHDFHIYTAEPVRGSDSVESLLTRLGVNDPAAAAYIRGNGAIRGPLLGLAGRVVRAEATDSHGLVRLTMRWASDDPARFKRLVVERDDGGRIAGRIELVPYTASVRIGSGTLRSSLFAAVDEAGLPDEVARQFIDIFGTDIDFHRGLHRGDSFRVVYELLEADGEPLRGGRVLTAEFVNAGRAHQAIFYQEPGQAGGSYYDFGGRSLERSFLASPMEFSRVTSGFAMRMHPIMNTWRAHTGVDYGAPTGTPVRTVADGTVEFAGRKGGYGNVVQIAHGKGDSTLYAHLSRIDVRPGTKVAKGQRIGAVGQTGWATGPHLHFEFREQGRFRDPLEVARQSQSRPLSAWARADFDRMVGSMRTQLAAAALVAAGD